MSLWPYFLLLLYVTVGCRSLHSSHHGHGYGEHKHGGSSYDSEDGESHGDYESDGEKSHGVYGLEKVGGHKAKGSHGGLNAFFSDFHNRGLIARDRGFGYEKAYAYDKQVALKDIGAKKSSIKGLQRAREHHGHKKYSDHGDYGHKSHDSGGRHGASGYSKEGSIEGSHGTYDDTHINFGHSDLMPTYGYSYNQFRQPGYSYSY
ncbi:filaggrin-2-like [Centruroides vittatus]|uniref:filaggrin-2-like n=1 Tax=Centruroides vittatus TaxID=120091 RepID=UPI0035100B23